MKYTLTHVLRLMTLAAVVWCFWVLGRTTLYDLEGSVGYHTADSLAAAREKFIASRDEMGKSIETTGKVTKTLDTTLTSPSAPPLTLQTQVKDVLKASTELAQNLQQFKARTARLDEECAAIKVRLQDQEQATADRNIKSTEEAIDDAIMTECADAVAESHKFIGSLASSLAFASDLAHLSEVLDAVPLSSEGSDSLRQTLGALRGQSAQYSSKFASLRESLDNLPAKSALLSQLRAR